MGVCVQVAESMHPELRHPPTNPQVRNLLNEEVVVHEPNNLSCNWGVERKGGGVMGREGLGDWLLVYPEEPPQVPFTFTLKVKVAATSSEAVPQIGAFPCPQDSPQFSSPLILTPTNSKV